MCVHVHMCMCAGVSEDRKIASDHNHLELKLHPLTWMLGTEFGSSARSMHALNH